MDFTVRFLQTYWMYCQELWLVLAVGFLISGFFYTFVPENLIERHLGEKGLKPILISSFFGALLPVCCIGSLPIAVTLRRKGAALGAVLAFLVATPATSVSALIVCWKLLGLTFTVFIFFAIIIMSIVLGMIINSMKWDAVSTQESQGRDSCCCHAKEVLTIWQKLRNALFYAFVTLPKEIGVEILIGIAVASFITVFEPIQHVIRDYLVGAVGYLFVLIVGLMTYVCSTASVPMADAFLKSGMTHGQALCYLLVGPITSYGTMLVIRKDFGRRILIVYLSVISILSLMFGVVYDVFF